MFDSGRLLQLNNKEEIRDWNNFYFYHIYIFFFPEPVKEPFKHGMSNSVAHEKSEVKELACGQCETKSRLLVSKLHTIFCCYRVYIIAV